MSFQKILAVIGGITLIVIFRVQIVQLVNLIGTSAQQAGR